MNNDEKIITIRIKDLLKTRKERKSYRSFLRVLNELTQKKVINNFNGLEILKVFK
jgi:effector-binding domain-containing protein